MKKINSLIPVVVSLVVSGCSSSSDPTPETNTTTKPIQCENNQTNINGVCVDNNTTTPIVCGSNQTQVNGKCVDNNTTEITCETGQELVNGTCQDVVVVAPTLAKINGTVFDGIVSGATMSSCEIVNDIKVEANSTCTSSKIDGTFSCEYKALNGNTLIVKAVGGKDLGADDIVSNDDKTNTYTLKTVFEKSNDINNTKVFATPLSTLVVQKMADSNWAKPLTDAESEVKTAINTTENILTDSTTVRKYAGMIANIWDTSSDLNLSKFANETSIIDGVGSIVSGIISKYNPKISIEAESVISNEIVKIFKVDERNSTIANEKTIDLLVKRAENNSTVSEKIAENFVKVVNKNYNTSNDTLNIVATITDKKVTVEDIVSLSENIETILNGATDKTEAIVNLNEMIDTGKSLTDLNVSTMNEEILKRTPCPTGKVKDVDGMTCIDKQIILKDAVNSPECIPALPSDDVKVINDGTFPSIPSQNDYNSSYETDFNNSYETTYPNYTCVGEANITTAPWEANATITNPTSQQGPA